MEPVNNSNLEAVPHIVDESAKQVSINMLTALMAGQQAKLNFTRLVEKHVTAELKKEFTELDERTKLIYNKVFQATCVHIKTHSQPLDMAINQIAVESGVEQAKLFLDSFAFPVVQTMIQKLKEDHPDALEFDKMWEPSLIEKK